MKEESKIEAIFSELQGAFDLKEPKTGHQERFLRRLNESQGTIGLSFSRNGRNWWKPLAIAASLAVIAFFGIGLINLTSSVEDQVAHIAPEMPQTKVYFANLIEEQVKGMEAQRNEDTEVVVQDALQQLERLENDYKVLELELIEGKNPNVILSAMIRNLQNRIDVLDNYMTKISMINSLKTNNDENITI